MNISKLFHVKTMIDRVGLDPSSKMAGRLRAEQLNNMVQVTPLMMMANIVNASIAASVIYAYTQSLFILFWAGLINIISVSQFYNWFKRRNISKITSASHRGLLQAQKGALVLGAIWGILPALYYSSDVYQVKLLVIALASGMLGGGAMALYVLPRAMFAFLGAIAFGCGLGLLNSGAPADIGVVLLLCCYVVALFKAGSTMSTTHAQGFINNLESSEKSETIGLLLKDFSENASDWLWETDAEGNLTTGKKQFEEHLTCSLIALDPKFLDNGYTVSDGKKCRIKGLSEIWQRFSKQQGFRDFSIMANCNANEHWINLSGKPIYNDLNEFCGYRGVASEITDAKKAEARIAYLAHNDALTGLTNRINFAAAIEKQLKEINGEKVWGVLYLDLDGFKLVNDRRGHSAGDDLLINVASRLKKTVGANDIVARLGGDEFAVLCLSRASVQSISALAEDLVREISAPYSLSDGHLEVGIGVSIGVAIGSSDGQTTHELLNNADLALYRAKSEGKGTHRFYEMAMDEVIKDIRSLEHDLRDALKNNELSISYQPLVTAEQNRTTGFEALIRWKHPLRGNISPAEFIPIAERIGLISEIGNWVMNEACKQATTWPDHLTVAVNLSPQQFHKKRIIQSVKNALNESGLNPARLEMEITEGLFIDNTEEVLSSLKELKELGVSIALDDFGTGYSSLSYLLKFPFDKLKIDRSFINQIGEDSVARNVLEAIAKLGNVLHLKVTAEGVETLEQVEALKGLDCTHFQGFLFGKPLNTLDLPAYLLHELSQIAEDEAALKLAGNVLELKKSARG